MAALDLTALEAAIYSWIALSLPALGARPGAIRWGQQSAPVADAPFAVLTWASPGRPIGRGQNVEQTMIDVGGDTWELQRSRRQELALFLELEADDTTGAGSALALLAGFLAAQDTAAVAAVVDALPASVLRFEPPVDTTAAVSDRYRTRARMRIALYSLATTTEAGDIGASAEFAITVTEA